MKRISVDNMTIQATVWLALPSVIWLATWLRPWIGIPVAAAVVFALFCALRGIHAKGDRGGLRDVTVDRRYWLIAVVLVLFVFFSGIGAIWYQISGDKVYRNSVFLALSQNPWPVNIPAADGTPSVLTYFFGFWLPAALVSKAAGFVLAGDIAQFLYACWGLFIIFNFIFAIFGGKARWLVVAVFFLYCGWDAVIYLKCEGFPQSFLGFVYHQKDISTNYYASNAVYTYFIHNYNQAYPSFMGMLLLWRWRREFSSLVLIYSLMFIGAAFPTAGLLPLVIYWMLKHYTRHEWNWKNMVGILVFLLISAYFLGSNNGRNPFDSAGLVEITREAAALIFIFFSYVVFLPWIWRSVRKDPIFWILFVTMALAPIVSLNGKGDFGWRAGVPFAAYFMFCMMRHILRVRNWKRPRNLLLGVALAIGSVAPITFYVQMWVTPMLIATDNSDIINTAMLENGFGFDPSTVKIQMSLEEFHNPEDRCYGNFFADGDTFFTRYIMKGTRYEARGTRYEGPE